MQTDGSARPGSANGNEPIEVFSPATASTTIPANTARFVFEVSGADEELRLVEFQGKESISELYEFHIIVASNNDLLTADEFIGKSGLLILFTHDQNELFHGDIIQFQHYSEHGAFQLYKLVLAPHFRYLTLRHNQRIFQHLSVPEVIEKVFNDAGINPEHYEFRLTESYAARSYCVQYDESEFDFLSRLMAEEGLHYFFEHRLDHHIMVIGDHNSAFPLVRGEPGIGYHPANGLNPDQQVIHSFHYHFDSGHGKTWLRDYNFTKPLDRMDSRYQGQDDQALEDYHYPGGYLDNTGGTNKAQLVWQQHQVHREKGNLKSNCPRLRCGSRFQLSNNPNSQYNRQYLMIAMIHSGSQPQVLDEYGAGNVGQYHNEGQCILALTPFKSRFKGNKPLIAGYHSGVVTGPADEEIYTNQHAQSKIQFPWDREGQLNETSSCWLRSTQSWAGKQWGSLILPRMGHEAKVSYIHGDPDRPIITGRLYHELNRSPYNLPKHKTRATFKTNSTMGSQGFNELRIEDKKNQEQLFFHAQKDLDIRVKNDRRDAVKHDRHLIVDNNRYEHIRANSHHTTDKQHNESIGQQLSASIGQIQHSNVGQSVFTEVAKGIHYKAGRKIVLEAATELIIKAGGGFIKIDPSGITAQGARIDLNGGTGSDSASQARPIKPAIAAEADKDSPGQSFKPIPSQGANKTETIAFKGEIARLLQAGNDHEQGICIPCQLSVQEKPQVEKQQLLPITSNSARSPLAPLPLESLKKTGQEQKHWLELVLLDEEGRIMPFVPYQITFARGDIKTGQLDKNGFVHLDDIPGGVHQIVFQEPEISQQQKASAEPELAPSKPKTEFKETDIHQQKQLTLNTVNQFRLVPYKLESTYAFEQLHSLADDVAEITFMIFMRQIFGAQIPVSATSQLYRDLSDGKVINPEIIVTVHKIDGHKGAYNNNDRKIYVYQGLLRDAIEDNDKKAELLALLVEEYGHHIDNLLRTEYSDIPIRDTDSLDEGAKYAYSLFDLDIYNQTATHFADLNSPKYTGQMILDLSEMHNSLKSYVPPEQQYNDKTSNNDLEFFGAKTEAQSTDYHEIEYDHFTIEAGLSPELFAENELNAVYYGNWLRDFSQLITGSTIRLSNQLQQELKQKGRSETFLANKPESSPTLLSYDAMIKLIEIMAVKKFQFEPMKKNGKQIGEHYYDYLELFEKSYGQLSKQKLGFYRPEEHIDNPKGLTDESAILSYTNETGKTVSLYSGEISESFEYDKNTGVANYIIKDLGPEYPSAITYMLEQLNLAMDKGRNTNGFINFGAALHVLEDYFAHSNFVEIALIKSVDTNVYPWVEVNENNRAVSEPWMSANGTKINKDAAKYPIVTGRFGLDDTTASIAPKLADILFSTEYQYHTYKPGERTFQDVAIMTVLNDLKTAQQTDSDKKNKKYQGKSISYWINLYETVLKFRDYRAEKIETGDIEGNIWELYEQSTQRLAHSMTLISNFVFSIILDSINESISDHQTIMNENIGINPSHTQLAKDPVEHHFNGLAGELAEQVVYDLAKKMDQYWAGKIDKKQVLDFASGLFVHPLKATWQDKKVIEWAKSNPEKLSRSYSKTTIEHTGNIAGKRIDELEKFAQELFRFFGNEDKNE